MISLIYLFFLCISSSFLPTSSTFFSPWPLLPPHYDGVILPLHPLLLLWSLRFPLLSFRLPAPLLCHCNLLPLLVFRALHLRLLCNLHRNFSPFALGSPFVFLPRSPTGSHLFSSNSLPFSSTLPQPPPNFIGLGSPMRSFHASSNSFGPTSFSMGFPPTNGSLLPPSSNPPIPRLIYPLLSPLSTCLAPISPSQYLSCSMFIRCYQSPSPVLAHPLHRAGWLHAPPTPQHPSFPAHRHLRVCSPSVLAILSLSAHFSVPSPNSPCCVR